MSELYDYNNPEDVKKAMQEMEEFLTSLDKAKEQVQNIAPAFETELKKDCSILENTTASLQNELVTRTATNESVEQQVNNGQSRVETSLENLVEKLLSQVEELKAQNEALQNRSVFKEMGHEVAGGVKFIADKTKEGLNKAGETIKETADKAKGFFRNAFDKVKEVCKEGIQAGIKGIGVAVTKMHEVVDNTRQKCYDLVQDVKGKCKEILKELDRAKADKEYEKAQKEIEKAKAQYEKHMDKANDHYEKMAEANDKAATR